MRGGTRLRITPVRYAGCINDCGGGDGGGKCNRIKNEDLSLSRDSGRSPSEGKVARALSPARWTNETQTYLFSRRNLHTERLARGYRQSHLIPSRDVKYRDVDSYVWFFLGKTSTSFGILI